MNTELPPQPDVGPETIGNQPVGSQLEQFDQEHNEARDRDHVETVERFVENTEPIEYVENIANVEDGRSVGQVDTEDDQNEAGDDREVLRPVSPRVYLASLSDYNAGILHGEWIDADQEAADLYQAATAMLKASPSDPRAEEYAIHDFEGFGHYHPGEFEPLDRVSHIARGISEHGPAFGAWAEHCNQDDEALERFEDAYLGEWPSASHYAEQLLDDLGIDTESFGPEWLAHYIHLDIDSFARDLTLGGDLTVVEHEDRVWAFDGSV